jgi:NADH:ubiquinone oxidoreductase subunit F (NADH-binding)
MSRLWSWPIFFNPIIKDFYAKAVKEFEDRTMKGEYVDVEHLLYYLLPKEIVFNVEKIGVEGRLGAIEHLVQD